MRAQAFFLMSTLLVAVAAGGASPVSASESADQWGISWSTDFVSPILLRQGDAVVTDDMLDAMLEERVPAEDRGAVLSSPQRIAQMLENLVRLSGFFSRANELGLLDTEQAQRDLQRMILLYGADAYRRHFFESVELAGYETPAREIFLTEPQLFQSPATVDFWHVLVTVDGDEDEIPAMRRTIAAHEQLVEAEEDFGGLIGGLTDDPTYSENGGLFEDIDLEILVTQLAATLDEASPGVWLPPVRSSFGWHVVRLEQVRPGQRQDWEEAREQAEAIARQRHLQQALERLLREFGSEPAEFSEGAIARLRARHRMDAINDAYEREVSELMGSED